MTDFDFDELDKAVNGALGFGDDEVLTASDTPAPTSTTTPIAEPVPVVTPTTPSPSAPAMRRSGGRFMDVVHPSSDMRSRGGTSDLPKEVTAPVATPVVSQEVLSDAATVSEPDWATPLDSPFLPDAQVEKRPLGGSAPTGDSLTSAADAGLLLEEPDELRLEAPDAPLLEAPDESQDDKHVMPDPIDFASSAPAESAQEPPVVVDEPTSSELASDEDLSQAAALDAEVHPVVEEIEPEPIAGPVSITQQYKEKPVEVAESGAIYDTENYHQPIAAPAKKKSGAWVILWIFLILLIGGGAGAAYYFFILPTM